jgi:UDP-N-acetylmuramoyl-tripeptide--D-alanyl-D-alanine ligase
MAPPMGGEDTSRTMTWTWRDVIAATGARAPAGDPRVFAAVCTDSRRVSAEALFVALRGPHHDGHRFAAEALAKGARAVVVEHIPPGVAAADALVVPDTLRALGDLAAWIRRRQAPRVVAITGSNGKTTTKELVASIGAQAAFPPPRTAVLKTLGNENNLVGVPLTLLRLSGDEAVAVLEMGMNAPGEIARLTAIADPDVGLITNVGPAHLEGLASIAGVAAAKGELFAGLRRDATIAVNTADEWVVRLAAAFPGRHVTFGPGGTVRAQAVVDCGLDGTRFELWVAGQRAAVQLPIPGAHNVMNALAAAAAAHALGVDVDPIARGLAAATPPPMRTQVVRLANGVTVLNDGYNANPASMEAALRLIAAQPGRRLAALGEMRELGPDSTALHHALGAFAATCGLTLLIAVGPQADATARGARAAGMDAAAVLVCDEPAEAAHLLIARWQAGDTILIKGSRGPDTEAVVRRHGARMAAVVRLLEEAGGRP